MSDTGSEETALKESLQKLTALVQKVKDKRDREAKAAEDLEISIDLPTLEKPKITSYTVSMNTSSNHWTTATPIKHPREELTLEAYNGWLLTMLSGTKNEQLRFLQREKEELTKLINAWIDADDDEGSEKEYQGLRAKKRMVQTKINRRVLSNKEESVR